MFSICRIAFIDGPEPLVDWWNTTVGDFTVEPTLFPSRADADAFCDSHVLPRYAVDSKTHIILVPVAVESARVKQSLTLRNPSGITFRRGGLDIATEEGWKVAMPFRVLDGLAKARKALLEVTP